MGVTHIPNNRLDSPVISLIVIPSQGCLDSRVLRLLSGGLCGQGQNFKCCTHPDMIIYSLNEFNSTYLEHKGFLIVRLT